jgi:hypothetical protein
MNTEIIGFFSGNAPATISPGATGPNTTSPVKNHERSRWASERWNGGGKESDMSLSALSVRAKMTARA